MLILPGFKVLSAVIFLGGVSRIFVATQTTIGNTCDIDHLSQRTCCFLGAKPTIT